MAEDQAFVTARRLAVVAGDDLAIGAADAERDRLDQQRAVRGWAARARPAIQRNSGSADGR